MWGSPVDRFCCKQKGTFWASNRHPFSQPSRPLRIDAGGRRIILRKLVAARRTPDKKPLLAWLAAPAPSRSEIRDGMMALKKSLEALMNSK